MAHEGVSIHSHEDPNSTDRFITARFSQEVLMASTMADALVVEIMRKIAERYVEEHYGEIAAKLNPEAIANLAIAESARKIGEEIRCRPKVVHEKETHTEVYQRGILGGMKRIR